MTFQDRTPLRVDVFADVACPWCYIGLRRLERALEAQAEWRVQRVWQPFQLQPDLPPEGLEWTPFAHAKFGGPVRTRSAFQHVAEAGREDGIHFNLEGIARASNTENAHRVILHARMHGLEWPVVDALFGAYFSHARNLSDPETLVAVAASVGLEPSGVRAMLLGEAFKTEVNASQREAACVGVRGVPFYVLDGRYAISGAQPVPVFIRALEMAHQNAQAAS